MKSFKYFAFFSIFFFAVCFLNDKSAMAGTFTGTLGSDGIVHLNADFTEDFTCVPSGTNPLTQISELMGCYVLTSPGWTAAGDRRLWCPWKGKSHTYNACSAGGHFVNGVCGTKGANASVTVTEETDAEVEITSPSGRVQPGVQEVVVEFDFKYEDAPNCIGQLPIRNVSVDYSLTPPKSNLPVIGAELFNLNVTSGYVLVTARGCCGGHCMPTQKWIYVEPEDDHCSSTVGGVSAGTGRLTTSEPDFNISGIAQLSLARYYNTKNAEIGKFGPRWSHAFDKRAIAQGNSYKVINDDATIHYYMDNDGDSVYMPELPKGLKSRVIKNPDNSVVREFDDGSKEEFNSYSYLTAIVDRNGNRINLTRDANNKLTKITDPSGREINVTYNASNYISQITLPDGKIISYTYVSGRLQKVTYPDGSYRTYEYSGYNLTGVKNENGNHIKKYTYDAQSRVLTSSVDGTNEKLTFAYVDDAHSTVTDTLGRITTYTIDKTKGKSHATSISGPGCKECGQGNVSYAYDGNLNITSSTDANGNVTTFTYDTDGNMLTKTEAYGTAQQRTTTYTYNSFGQPLTITYPAGNTTTFTYDEKGNLLSTTDAQANITSFTYNPQGLMTSMTDPQGNVTTYAYNQYGNLASVTDHLGHVTSYTYDTIGKLLTMTDANNNQTTYTYDQRGRLTQVRDSLNQTPTYTYDPAGNLTAITDARNNTTQFAYDSINRLITETNPLGNQRTYAYNSVSNLTSKTDANGQATNYIYDDYNRLTTINHPGGVQTIFTYDNLGNMTGTTNPNISYTMTYDALNRKTSITDSLSRNINYAYDANSNKVTMTDPAGTTTYVYNTLNRLTSLTDPAAKTYTFTYDTTGKRTGLALPNGIPISYTYDNVSRLLSIINGTVSTNSYVYDNIGNRTSMTNPSGTHNYGYDVIYRLLQATHPIPPTEQFTYDPVGNRLTDGSSNSYFYNNANRLLNYNGVTFTYDANGNATSRVDSCGTTTYTWDSENRLTGISGFQPNCSALTASYKYDPLGRRIEKNVNGTITKYLYDEEDILLEYDGNNQIVSRYTHGPGIDEPLSMEKNSQKYYYHFDGLGSVTGITDSTGNVVQRYEYDSFGNVVSVLDPNFVQPYTYTSREYDPESGLYFYRARHYDAKVGRFISEDPIGFKSEDMNFFSYVYNRPVIYTDPLGLKGCGPGSGFWKRIIPDKYPFQDFRECCDEHDDCYCGKGQAASKGKLDCDFEFCKCLYKKSLFARLFPGGSLPSDIYCHFVLWGGGPSFRKARGR